MKLRYFAIVAAVLATVFSANAEEKLGNDIWIGVNAGVISTQTTHFNTPAPYVGIELGKWFTPVWGARIDIAGPCQYFDKNNKVLMNGNDWSKQQYFGELNVDGILNISQAISKKSLPLVDFYLFLGPTMNIASKCTEFTGSLDNDGKFIVEEVPGMKARFGATAGLGLGFNLSKCCNLGLEWRTGVTPSVFGAVSYPGDKAQNTNRFTVRFAYTFGGRLGKDGFAKKHGRVEEKLVEVPVEKIVEKEVIKEVVKEVAKEVANPAASYVFFKIDKANLTNPDKVRLDAVAAAIKAGAKDVVYTISGFADKATGSASYNKTLSEKRAKVVYDYLVKAGVDANQLKVEANGGVDNMFFNQASLSRVTIIGR